MTLIITELSTFGIAMVADSAVTYIEQLPSGKETHHVLNGARKLQFIPQLSAGISMWGRGSIPTKHGEIFTYTWLGDFIEQHSDVHTIDDFANILANELQALLHDKKEPLGFHLAGYIEIDGIKMPTFYHVRNVDGDFNKYEHHEFIPGQDFPPRELPRNKMYITRNGDYGPYAVLSQAVFQALPAIQGGIGLDIPHPSLQGRMSYHSAWVRFVSELYASSRLLKTIGGNIASLGIYPGGQIDYSLGE